MNEHATSLDAGWECAGLAAGWIPDPGSLGDVRVDWLPAQVPGTAAGALMAAGRALRREDFDDLDWWWRCRFTGRPGPHRLELGGIATVADVWLNGAPVLHSDNMHRARAVAVDLERDNELVIRCGALSPVLARRRSRPRWKTYLVDHQQLRWVRTSLLGRIPGWAVVPPVVGPWRPVVVAPADGSAPAAVSLLSRCTEGGGGTVAVSFELPGAAPGAAASVQVGGVTVSLARRERSGAVVLEGTVTLPHVDRWWPHTHGSQPLYEVRAEVGSGSWTLGRVGFRTVDAVRDDGAFTLVVNGERLFCRGAVWTPPDPVTMTVSEETEARLLGLVQAAGMNLLRCPGTTVYESERFFERCDELGILVWQDCMFAFMDPPADDAFEAEAEAEVTEALTARAAHPCLAVVCGNQEVEEVAAMLGLETERRSTPLFDKTLAAVAAAVVPDVPYVASNPTGGDPPFRMDAGLSQYFGVGGYLRPPEDARRSGVRFAAECLAFATPPEPQTIEERCGGAYRAGHDPRWKEGVHHDAGRSWDMEDVRDHYVSMVFGLDARAERYRDAERALELGRAANAWLMERVFTEWRRPGSVCDGGIVLGFADLRPGAGWGIVDAVGRPKAPWYALRRVLQPLALLASDEGLNGLALHVVNDTASAVRARLSVELVSGGETVVEHGEASLEVPARGTRTIGAEEVLGAWRDVTYAYRFAPPAHDAVVATLRPAGDPAAPLLAQVVHLPLGQARPLEADLGLSAVARRDADGCWKVQMATRRLAQWVALRVPGFVPADSWFHLPASSERTVELWPEPGTPRDRTPHGAVHALNSARPVPVRLDGT